MQSSKHIPTKVKASGFVTQEIKMISLVSADGQPLPDYTPGPHIDVDIGKGKTRSYSLMSMPMPKQIGAVDDNVYTLGVLLEAESTGGSKFMHGLKIGDEISISSPKNDFALHPDAQFSLLLAGGIGITPIMAMVAHLQNTGTGFALHYAGRTCTSLAFVEALQTYIGFNLHIHYDDEENALDIEAVLNTVPNHAHIYVCGPKGMIEAVQKQALACGYPKEQIHFELFATPSPQAGDTEFEIELSSSGKIYTVPVGKTIIEVLEAAGEDPIYDCSRGDCGICQTGVISGEIDHRDVVLSEAEKAAGDVMQICVSRARGAKIVLDL